MILNSLCLTNFGIFKGSHSIQLTPRVKYGRKRPIILFGGLNGAGKTTTLSAIRIALYGKQSFGRALSLQQYHKHLSDLIHNSSNGESQPDTAEVKLAFTIGRYGKINDFQIVRNWERKNSKIIENFSIAQDGEPLDKLNEDQKQSLLNELIPIGVSDLFFFDGEKIAELAEDESNETLADAIKRLLGLDIIDRLRADLGTYLREKTQSDLPKDISKEIRRLESQYNDSYACYENKLSELNELKTTLISTSKDIESVKLRINDLGGAWAKSREAAELQSDALVVERGSIIEEIQTLMSDSLPLALAKKSLLSLQRSLNYEKETKDRKSTRNNISKSIQKLELALADALGQNQKRKFRAAIDSAFSDIQDESCDTIILHDISDSTLSNVNQLIESYLPQQEKQLKNLHRRLSKINTKLEDLSNAIARAPDQSRLENVLEELGELQGTHGKITSKIEYIKNEAKQHLRAAMDQVRRMRDLDKRYTQTMSQGQGLELAARIRGMLEEFSEKTKLKKITMLEEEFIKAFSKLARKEDISFKAKIDPNNFNLSLIDIHGNAINKKKLSAGEKQIYAIAMLEALGRTSGRNLPIIIDTPLGRLDSKHRNNLVKNYFPSASHQVLILSTDTEIDESFYAEISPEISHAFSVNYIPDQSCSYFSEGYFWR